MAQYTWRVPKHKVGRIRRLLAEAAQPSGYMRLLALREELKSIHGFPMGVRPGDTVTVEAIDPVLSYSSAGQAQASGQLVGPNGKALNH